MKLIILCIVLCSTHLYAQVLNNRNGEAFTDEPFFNHEFVKANKIKKIEGEFQYMKSRGGLHSTDFKYVYKFDNNGRLISTFETRTDDGTVDTTWNLYSYNEQDYLVAHRKTDLDGFKTVKYTRDSLGRILTEEYFRDIDNNGVIERSLAFNKESVKYFDYDHQTKRTRFNNYDLPYLDEYFHYNELGYLVERIERIKMTGDINTWSYEYNREGKLAAIRKTSNRYEGYLEEMTFDYDELGNITEKLLYKKGVFTTDIQIIYSSKSKLLQSVMIKEVATDFLMVIRFRDYEFYE